MKKLLVLVLAAVLVLSACAAPASTPTTTPASADQPATQRDTVNIAVPSDFSTMDPAFIASSVDFVILANVYDSLVKITQEGEIVPRLAESFEVSEDGLVYTFKIREGVSFHNGAQLDASDVIYSLERSMASPYMALFTQYIASFEQTDDYTVKINLHEPAAPFLMALSNFFGIVDKDTVEEAGEEFKNHPIGTGAYMFVERKQGESLTLTVNEDYYAEKGKIKNVVYRVITDPSNALIALENGDIDICSYVPPASLDLVRENEELDILPKATSGITFVTMDVTKEALSDVRVRQAIAYAMDKQSIIDGAQEGEAYPAEMLINSEFVAYSPGLDGKGYPFDMEKAKSLLAEAGYPNGEGLPPMTISSYDLGKKTAELVAANLMELGFVVEIELLEVNAFIQSFSAGNMQMGVMTIGLGDDASSMSMLLEEGAPYNISWYKNDRVEELFAEGSKELDVTKRQKIYEELYLIVKEEAPYVPLYFNKYNYCHCADLNLDHFVVFSTTILSGLEFR